VGVSESVLSRFLSGKQGLTLASVDKLADALGLEVVGTVQRVRRQAPKGRRPKEKPRMIAPATKPAWHELAFAFAKDAHEDHFPSRRGVWHIEDLGVLCLYNNNPYANYPALRDEETAAFRKRMRAAGIKVLAYATYPPEGEESAGYTYAMLLDAGQDKQSFVADTMADIVKWSHERMK